MAYVDWSVLIPILLSLLGPGGLVLWLSNRMQHRVALLQQELEERRLIYDKEQAAAATRQESEQSAIEMAQFLIGEARKTETELRDRLSSAREEFDALLRDHRELSRQFDKMQYQFYECRRAFEATQKAVADQEVKIQGLLRELAENAKQIDLMKSQTRDHRLLIQQQSVKEEQLRMQNTTLRQRIELYEERMPPVQATIDTKLLGRPEDRDEQGRYIGGNDTNERD